MDKKPIHTVHAPSGGWENKREKSTSSLGKFTTKVEAEKAGRDQAKHDKTEHVIHKMDGKIGEKNSYGNDPNPPKDKK